MAKTPSKSPTTKNKYLNKYSRVYGNKTHAQCSTKRALIKDRVRKLEFEIQELKDINLELINGILRMEMTVEDFLNGDIPNFMNLKELKTRQLKLTGGWPEDSN